MLLQGDAGGMEAWCWYGFGLNVRHRGSQELEEGWGRG
jgi:hypothetical protein